MNSSNQTNRLTTVVLATLLLTAFSAGATFAGQSKGAGGELPCDATGQGSEPPADLCIEADDADTQWRYIGRTSGLQCPAAQFWTRSRLFNVDGGDIPPGLEKFCLYRADTFPPAIGALQAQQCISPGVPKNCLSDLDPDSASMSMMASQMAGLLFEPLREHFLEQVGHVGPLPASPVNTALVVIDTEPDGINQDRNGPGTSQHGFTLINMLRDMICPVGGPCAVQLRSTLGLPLIRCASNTGFCEDTTNGGYAGTIGQLAQAIRKSVAEWGTSPVENLVINLSVAWDPVFGGDEADITDSPVAVQAVYRALQDASCRGALVIAAAGNRVSGPAANVGPLYPAGWETEAAPDDLACEALTGFEPDGVDQDGSYRPLVYASGAVHTDNTPAETRNLGEPPLVGFGDHAASRVDDIIAPAPTQIHTGSSVAAAVVSAAAAAAWHFRDTAGPHQIMDAVYNGSFSVGREADFCNGAQPCNRDVRRVTICQSVQKACDDLPGATCPNLACEIPDDVLIGLPEDDVEQLFADAMAATFSLDTLTKRTPVSACRPDYVLNHEPGTNADDPCPQQQYYSLQATPWTDGQPEGQFCPTCMERYHSPGKLYLEIDSALVGELSQITLLCGTEAYRVPGILTAGSMLVIEQIPEECETQDVAVAYVLDDGIGSKASLASAALTLPDRDDDDIQDGLDNCLNVANPDQVDADSDGIGNRCDGDADQDCAINFQDLGLMKQGFFSSDPVLDLDSSGSVNFVDLGLLKGMFFGAPGPSGTDNLCD